MWHYLFDLISRFELIRERKALPDNIISFSHFNKLILPKGYCYSKTELLKPLEFTTVRGFLPEQTFSDF